MERYIGTYIIGLALSTVDRHGGIWHHAQQRSRYDLKWVVHDGYVCSAIAKTQNTPGALIILAFDGAHHFKTCTVVVNQILYRREHPVTVGFELDCASGA